MEEDRVHLTLTNGFSGSYDLLKFIIAEFNINSGLISSFAEAKGYTAHCAWKGWTSYGVPIKIWNTLHKDLTILNKSRNDQKYTSLEDLKKQYKEIHNG